MLVLTRFYCTCIFLFNNIPIYSSRDDKERNSKTSTNQQINSKHTKSEDSYKSRSNPSSQNSAAKDNSASRNNHDNHTKEPMENGEDGLSERDPKRRKTETNDKEKEISRIKERRDDSDKGLCLYL